jgi:hypothetical protein
MNRFIEISPVVTANDYYTIADLPDLKSLHTNLLGLSQLSVSWQRIYNMNFKSITKLHISNIAVLSLIIFLLATLMFPCNFGTQAKWPVFCISYKFSARTPHRNTASLLFRGADFTENAFHLLFRDVTARALRCLLSRCLAMRHNNISHT